MLHNYPTKVKQAPETCYIVLNAFLDLLQKSGAKISRIVEYLNKMCNEIDCTCLQESRPKCETRKSEDDGDIGSAFDYRLQKTSFTLFSETSLT